MILPERVESAATGRLTALSQMQFSSGRGSTSHRRLLDTASRNPIRRRLQVEPCSGQIISGRQPGSFTVEFACGGSGRQIPRVECKRIGGYPLRPGTLPSTHTGQLDFLIPAIRNA